MANTSRWTLGALRPPLIFVAIGLLMSWSWTEFCTGFEQQTVSLILQRSSDLSLDHFKDLQVLALRDAEIFLSKQILNDSYDHPNLITQCLAPEICKIAGRGYYFDPYQNKCVKPSIFASVKGQSKPEFPELKEACERGIGFRDFVSSRSEGNTGTIETPDKQSQPSQHVKQGSSNPTSHPTSQKSPQTQGKKSSSTTSKRPPESTKAIHSSSKHVLINSSQRSKERSSTSSTTPKPSKTSPIKPHSMTAETKKRDISTRSSSAKPQSSERSVTLKTSPPQSLHGSPLAHHTHQKNHEVKPIDHGVGNKEHQVDHAIETHSQPVDHTQRSPTHEKQHNPNQDAGIIKKHQQL